MRFAGFADEVSGDITRQIQAVQALGWRGIELRLVGKGLHVDDVDEAQFGRIAEALEAAGIRVVAYGSQIANWARKISGDFARDVTELRRMIPRMRRTGTEIVRVMSYPNDGWSEGEWREEVLRRFRELTRIAEDGGVVLAHENCDGWAGQGPRETLELLGAVGSPALKLIYDTGNPVAHGQDPWAYYLAVREQVVHVHIKDYARDPAASGGYRATSPGEGAGRVREIVSDLKRRGYGGWYSIEPHILSVIHEGKDATGREEEAWGVFQAYGRAFETLYRRA
jgi:sugar phosphate isomerase/epimerase